MKFKEGNKFGKGRPKGHGNKSLKTIYDIYTEAFELLGGVEAFCVWAKKNPNQFYNIHSKLIPVEVKLESHAPTEVRLSLGGIGEKIIENLGREKDKID
jgi:hypothetical protein